MNALYLLSLDLRDIARSLISRRPHSSALAPISHTKFNLYCFSPYSLEGKLGRAYNQYMELVPDDEDWVCFYDRDVLFLTPDYGHQICEIIARNPDAGLLTCLTNRIGCPAQLYRGEMSADPDILQHENIARGLQLAHRYDTEPISGPVSGFVMVLKKRVWKQVLFSETRDLLDVDYQFTMRLTAKGFTILLMKGIYVFHYYRLREGASHTAHLTGREQ